MAANVSAVLNHKGRHVVTVTPHQSVAAVVKVLVANRIGAVPVVDEDGLLLGIISERDIIRGMSEQADAVLALPAEQLMTRQVKTCAPEDQLVEIMQVMTLQRVRHLPVVQNGALHGIISIGDVVKQRLDELQFETDELRRYICSS
jgi:CBS domain-containing protein